MIPIYGINGAAIASAISVGFTNIMRFILVYRDLNIHPYNISYLNAITSILVSLIVSIIFNSILNVFWIIQLILISLFMFILFIIIYYYIGFSDEDLFILNKIKNKALSIKNNQ
jgi:O-antigen/teichoic acid export membrane protein